MAIDALRASGVSVVVVMLRGVVMRRLMALGAHTITRRAQIQTMRLMAVTAHYTGLVHFTLHEGTVFIDLVTNLSVGVVQGRLRQSQAMSVKQVRAIMVIT
jgi:hypothetical protein